MTTLDHFDPKTVAMLREPVKTSTAFHFIVPYVMGFAMGVVAGCVIMAVKG